jgi:hypothetical protein
MGYIMTTPMASDIRRHFGYLKQHPTLAMKWLMGRTKDARKPKQAR